MQSKLRSNHGSPAFFQALSAVAKVAAVIEMSCMSMGRVSALSIPRGCSRCFRSKSKWACLFSYALWG